MADLIGLTWECPAPGASQAEWRAYALELREYMVDLITLAQLQAGYRVAGLETELGRLRQRRARWYAAFERAEGER